MVGISEIMALLLALLIAFGAAYWSAILDLPVAIAVLVVALAFVITLSVVWIAINLSVDFDFQLSKMGSLAAGWAQPTAILIATIYCGAVVMQAKSKFEAQKDNQDAVGAGVSGASR